MSKKNWLVVKLVVLILLFIAVATILFSIFVGDRFGFKINSSWNGYLNDGIPTQQEQSFEGIEKVVVYSYSLPIEIIETDRNDVLLIDNSDSHLANNEDNLYVVEDDTLYFEQAEQIAWFGFNNFTNSVSGEIIIEVPQDVELEYEINSVSEEILIDAFSDELTINNVSGNIYVLQGGDELNINGVSGSIEIADAFLEQKINSVSGNIYTVADKDSSVINVDTVSGGVDIGLANGIEYSINHDSVSGKVRDNYTPSDDGTSSDQKLIISVHSVSGFVDITNR